MLLKDKISKKNRSFIDCIEKIRSIRTVYSDGIDETVQEYDNAMALIKANYKMGTLAKEKISQAQTTKDDKMQELRSEASETIQKALDDCRVNLLADIRVINARDKENIDKIMMLSETPISALEFSELCEAYGGSYWVDKALAGIAKKNGIETDVIPVSADDKMAVLDDLQNAFDEYVGGYEGKDTPFDVRLKISDQQLLKYEDAYCKGYTSLSDDELATRAVGRVQSQKDVQGRGMQLSQELKDVPVSIQNRILGKLADSSDFQNYAYYAGKTASEIAENEKKLMDEANKGIEKLLASDMPNDMIAGTVLIEAKQNPYYEDCIEKLSRTNNKADEVSGIISKAKLRDNSSGNTKATDSLTYGIDKLRYLNPRDAKKAKATLEASSVLNDSPVII